MAQQPQAGDQFERKHVVRWRLILTCMFVSFGSMTYGASNAVISTTLGQPSFYNYMKLGAGDQYASQANSRIGAANSLYYAGGAFGPFDRERLWSKVVDLRWVYDDSDIASADRGLSSHWDVHHLPLLCGLGLNAYHCVAAVPHYITELVPPRDRGKLTDIHAVGINAAYVITGYIGLGFFFLDAASAWRGPLALTTIPPLVVCIGIYWLPETPRYLLSKGRAREAWETLDRLHRDRSDPRNDFAKREFYQIGKQMEMDRTLPSGYQDILQRPSYRKRAIITITLLFCVMSSGILVIQNYGVIIFKRLGFDNLDQLLFQTGYTSNALLWSVVAMTFVDRVPRDKLLGTGYGMCGVCLTIFTILTSVYEDSNDRAGLAASVFMMFAYFTCFELGLDGPEFFYRAEIWATHLRAKGYAIATCVYSGINVVWLQAAPTAFATIGYYYYIIFICCSAFGSAMAFFVFPDTLHKPLEEVAALFGDQDLMVVYQQQLDDAEVAATLDEVEASIPSYDRGGLQKEETEHRERSSSEKSNAG